MKFQKGHKINIGNKYRLGIPPWNKGKKLSLKIRRKLRLSHLGKKQSQEQIEKRRLVLIGKKRTQKFKDFISELYKGAGNPMWKGGITDKKRIYKREHKNWSKLVLVRDDFTCQECNIRGGRLEAHHIKSWSLFPNLQLDINNGQTLCRKCHGEKTSEELKIYWKNQFAESPAFNQQEADADQ